MKCPLNTDNQNIGSETKESCTRKVAGLRCVFQDVLITSLTVTDEGAHSEPTLDILVLSRHRHITMVVLVVILYTRSSILSGVHKVDVSLLRSESDLVVLADSSLIAGHSPKVATHYHPTQTPRTG